MSLGIDLRFGPSGWDHPRWDKLIYPRPQPRGFHPLEFLADRFSTVEICATSHSFLRPELARLWMTRVAHNPSFVFTARMPLRFSTERRMESEAIKDFKQGMRPLLERGMLGCLLMQFPWGFRFNAENRAFVISLRRAFHEFSLAAELLHDSWTAQEAIGTMIDYHIGFCNIDQPSSDHAMPPSAYLTTNIGYVKLSGRKHGPRAADYLYTMPELLEWRMRIARIRRFADRTFVVFANAAGGKAVINALQLQALMDLEKRPEAPAAMVEKPTAPLPFAASAA